MPSQRPNGPPCRECSAPTHKVNKKRLCPVCRVGFCSRCSVKLPPERHREKQPICLDCRHQDYLQERANHPRDCLDCGKPRDNYALRCHACNVDRYLLKRKALLVAGPQPCRDCSRLMPVGRVAKRCRECNRKWRLAQPGSRGVCARCGRFARMHGFSYCRFCNRIKSNLSRARARGEGKGLPKARKYLKWQKEESC